MTWWRSIPGVLRTLEGAGFIPVIAPIGYDHDGNTYNINADIAAGKIAAALKAEKLILMTDVDGVKDKDGKLMATLDAAQAQQMIERGTIDEGMIPKVECCINALREGVAKTHIIDGRVRHSLLLEIFTRSGIGTEVVRGARVQASAACTSAEHRRQRRPIARPNARPAFSSRSQLPRRERDEQRRNRRTDAQNLLNTYGCLPLAFVRGDGAYLYDADGNRYLDFFCGLAVTSLGHAHPRVVRAIKSRPKS